MMNHIADKVKIVEVGPRDGLQFEPRVLATADKVEFINRLSACGLCHIEVSSFVKADRVPQLADAELVFTLIQREVGIDYSALVPNEAGLHRALSVNVDTVSVFSAASESFCRNNIGCSIDQSLQRFTAVVQDAKQLKKPVRAYISCALGCPFEGAIKIERVADLAERLLHLGCDEISLGDTIGAGTPYQARELIRQVTQTIPLARLAVHFHDTRGQALANILACLEQGVRCVDSAVAGLGGCPYAPGASGNVATEDVAYMLMGMGIETGVNLATLLETARFICAKLGHEPRSKTAQAGIPAWMTTTTRP